MATSDKVRVLLVHANHPRLLNERMVGAWSYDVPEFEVRRHVVEDGYTVRANDWRGKVDVIFVEDSRASGKLIQGGIPIIYNVVDSTLSEEHFKARYKQAHGADLVLLDWDSPRRFSGIEASIKNWPYCVNDRFFHTGYGPKSIDVGYFCNMTASRKMFEFRLAEMCEVKGYSFLSGVRYGKNYPKSLCRSRVIANINRNPQTRSHRLFDAVACGAVVVSNKHPTVPQDRPHDAPWVIESTQELVVQAVHEVLQSPRDYEQRRRQGLYFIEAYHTWRVRAEELRELMSKEFSI